MMRAVRLVARNSLARSVAVGVLYYGGAYLGLSMALVRGQITPFWPPTGIAVASMLVFGLRMWPAIGLAALAVNLPLSPSPWVALVIACGNTLATVAATLLLRRVQFRVAMDRVRDVTSLIFLGAIFPMVISATVGVSALTLAGALDEFASAWGVWWTGDALGVAVFAPAIFVMLDAPDLEGSRARRTVLAGLVGLMMATLILSFSASVPVLVVNAPVAIALAWRYRQRGAVVAALACTIIPAVFAAQNIGQFESSSTIVDMILLQTFSTAMALTGYFIAATSSERAQAISDSHMVADQMEERVVARTAALRAAMETQRLVQERLESAQRLARIGDWEWDLASGNWVWSDALFSLYGLEPQSIHVDVGVQFGVIHEDDRESVKAVLEGTIERKGEFAAEHRARPFGGEVLWMYCQGRVVTDEAGAAIKMVGTTQDITAHKRAEQLELDLQASQIKRRQGLEINDEVVQGLAAAKMALEMDYSASAHRAVSGTLASARRIVVDLLTEDSELEPGDLVRSKPSSSWIGDVAS